MKPWKAFGLGVLVGAIAGGLGFAAGAMVIIALD